MVWRRVQSICIHHSDSNLDNWTNGAFKTQAQLIKRIHTMEFTLKFLFLSAIAAIALFCHEAQSVGRDFEMGFCGNMNSLVQVESRIVKQKSGFFAKLRNKRLDFTERFPTVIEK